MFIRNRKRIPEAVHVLNYSTTPAVHIVGEDNHYAKKNIVFKNKLKKLVLDRKNNFFIALEGQTFNLKNAKQYNFCGIQNKIVTFYVDCVTAYIWMNPENPHSKTLKPKIDQYVITNFLRLCQFVPLFWKSTDDKDKNMRSILKDLYDSSDNCRQYFDGMPGEDVFDSKGSMEDEWHISQWASEHGDYILNNIESFSNVMKEVILALRKHIQDNISKLATHNALSEKILTQLFSGKHTFKEESQTTPLMDLFLIDLKNQDWKINMLVINSYALAKGLPVIYVVGDSHIDGLKRCLGNRHGEYLINYYPSHDIKNSPLCFVDDMGTKKPSDFHSKMKI